MNVADYVLLAIIVLSAFIGIMRGFLREAVAVVSWVVALFCAWKFSALVEPYLGGALASPQVATWVARGIIFCVVLLIGTAIGLILSHFVRLSIFSGTDRFLGFLFGVARSGVAIGVLVILGQLVRLENEGWWRDSKLMPYAEDLGNVLRVLVNEPRRDVSI